MKRRKKEVEGSAAAPDAAEAVASSSLPLIISKRKGGVFELGFCENHDVWERWCFVWKCQFLAEATTKLSSLKGQRYC